MVFDIEANCILLGVCFLFANVCYQAAILVFYFGLSGFEVVKIGSDKFRLVVLSFFPCISIQLVLPVGLGLAYAAPIVFVVNKIMQCSIAK
jgi:hypothetical protein